MQCGRAKSIMSVTLLSSDCRLSQETVHHYGVLSRCVGASYFPALRGVGEWDGRQYYVTEFVDGCPIHAWAIENALPLPDRLYLFQEVCRCVEVLHRQGIAHGSLRVEHVLISRSGQVKLVGFERLIGNQESERTAAGDLADLGALLQTLLTNLVQDAMAPVEESLDTVAATMRMRPRWLKQIRRSSLVDIVRTARKAGPDPAYPSVASLRADIERYQNGLLPDCSRPAGILGAIRRNRLFRIGLS